MGNIRTSLIKRVAIKLVEKHPDKFTSEFEHNKQTVEELIIVSSKKLRNHIAGYATTYYRRKYGKSDEAS